MSGDPRVFLSFSVFLACMEKPESLTTLWVLRQIWGRILTHQTLIFPSNFR